MPPQEIHHPEASNLLGDALGESRLHFRKLLASLDKLIAAGRLDEARQHQPKLEALAQELSRLLNPRDDHDCRLRNQIERDVARVRGELKKGWGGAVGTGLAALLVGGVIGIAALIGLFILVFL